MSEEMKSADDLEIEKMLADEAAEKEAEEKNEQSLKELSEVGTKPEDKDETDHQERLRRVKEAKINKVRYGVVSEKFITHGNKIIKKEILVNGNTRRTYAGTKKSNLELWKKASKN